MPMFHALSNDLSPPPAIGPATPPSTPASTPHGGNVMSRSRTIPTISFIGPGPLLSVTNPSYLTAELDHVEAYQLYIEHKFGTPRQALSRSGRSGEVHGVKAPRSSASASSARALADQGANGQEDARSRRDSLAPPAACDLNKHTGPGSRLENSSSLSSSISDAESVRARGMQSGALGRSAGGTGIPTVRRYVCALTAAIGFLSYGYHLGELNNVSKLLTCQATSTPTLPQPYLFFQLSPCIPMSTFALSAANALIPIAGAFGALLGGYLAQRIGRIKTMVLFAILGSFSPILMTLATERFTFLIGRGLAGLAAGGHATSVPIYISEMAHPRRRSLFGVFSPVALSLGLALASLTGFYWSTNLSNWRNIFGVALIPPVIQVALLSTVCIESPQWFASVKYGARARSRSMMALKKVKPPPSPPPQMEISRPIRLGTAGSLTKLLSDSSNHLMPIKTQIVVSSAEGSSPTRGEQQLTTQREDLHSQADLTDDGAPAAVSVPEQPEPPRPVTLRKFVTEQEYRRPALILAFAHSASQLSGVNVYFVYSVSILSNVMSFDQANLFYLAFAFSNILLSALPGYLSERFGRRKLLLISMVGMATSAVILTLSVVFQLPSLSMAMFISAITMFQCGLASVPLILICELVEPKAVGAASSLAQVVSTCASTLALFVFPLALEVWGATTFLLFTGCLLVSGAALWLLLPETMGKSLDEVLEELSKT